MDKLQSPYGWELILDIHDCRNLPLERHNFKWFLVKLCELIGMEREDLHFWDYEGDDEGYKAAPIHLKGVSLVQFIKTSSIVIHTLDDAGKVYFNLFSCKEFDPNTTQEFVENYFNGRSVTKYFMERQ